MSGFHRWRLGLGLFAISSLVLGWNGLALAEEISPAIYLMIDTSGSMLLNTGSTQCHGDGSVEHPEISGCMSRIHSAKGAITTVVNSYPEVRWGLARFMQNEGADYVCFCSDQTASERGGQWNGACDNWFTYNYNHDLPSVWDPVCINYGGGIFSCSAGCCDFWDSSQSLTGADILVSLGSDNESTILMWVDQHESDFQTGQESSTGNHCWNTSTSQYGDCELRAFGGTPLGGALSDLYDQISNTDLGNDAVRGCRPYRIILLTDGEESCSGDPVAAATALRTTPDLQHTCANNDDCPPNSTCSGGRCRYDVRTYVIAFATSSSALSKANNIANAGGTGSAVPAWNEDDIVAAMAEVIADSLVSELCNGIDDDCDGDIDEDFPVGDACDNGLLGECHATGTYICDPSDPTSVICDVPSGTPNPGDNPEICNGLDDDCDGEVDEGGVCTCKGPELCNGFDDYCDSWASHAEGSEDPNVGQVCGTDVGACTVGTTYCWVDPGDPSHVEIRCSGIDPQPEVCDSNTEAHDQNCNGTNNDGIAPQPCQKTNTYGTCLGQQTCDEDGNWTCWAKDPAPEFCNNVDDDCDGATDENLTRTCQVSNTYGTCSGTETCTSGSWGACTASTPAAESCNNIDDDCDGATDENLTRTCQVSNTYGTCSGTETCSAGSWAGCSAQTPAAESCNNIDDDCDGATDENLSQTCYTGPAGTDGVGICHSGNQSCSSGTWGTCQGQQLPGTEVCDNLDNDCDGATDEDLGQTTCGLGVCKHTVENCVGGVPQSCDPYQGAGTETCNALDDDCDGVADGLQRQCFPYASGCTESNGSWSCLGQCRVGSQTCPAGGSGTWGACQGAVGPETEDCNGLDDDCDGSTDENLTQACYPPGYGASTGCTAPGSCLGSCHEGTRVCSGGGWGACQGVVTPASESCNDADDDCDGLTDENLSRSCQASNGFGTCTGTETCSHGAWGTCTAQTPAAESCNGIDDDCDGSTDEDLSRSCQVSNGFGTCTGTETCSAGSWVGCTASTPVAETCNDIDDDCDGATDENLSQSCYTGPAGTDGVGVCHSGNQSCSSGAWGTCQGQQLPGTEVCDNLDNDCDGSTDEELGQTTCGLGICEHTVQNCVGGVPQSCDPMQGATTETCNGLDDDCDGVADGLEQTCYPFTSGCVERFGVWTCEGVCHTGSQTCPAGGSGTWGRCQGAAGPSMEDCNGLDDDCDGQTDEGLSQACYPPGYGSSTGCTGPGTCLGACHEGTRACTGGDWGACQGAVTPQAETCDGIDNDCDGQTDEGLTRSCQVSNAAGTCTGIETCTMGSWGGCTASTPAPETCDGVDNDCNGQTDEGLGQTTCGVGICEHTIQNCVNGTDQTCDPMQGATTETCNGLDDDCDGATDENLTDTCYDGPAGTEGVGLCHGGQRACVNGSWGACQNQVVPATETCNGLDDDCDSQTDEDLGEVTCGLGVCRHTVESCVNGTPVNCDPYEGAGPETCNGLDDDCDGVADGLQRPCYPFVSGCQETAPGTWVCEGQCAVGTETCAVDSGVWGTCMFAVGPVAEICDGVDNDCDGQTDEDEQGNALTGPCYTPGSGQDTGCTFDETTGQWTCLGECRAGTRVCANAQWGQCDNEVTPAAEVCDNLDNDCDGQTDEPEDIAGLDQPCGTALGRCTPGILRCIDGQEICEGGEGPFEGVCNGEDDDCDGEIDEQDEVADEEGQPCGDATGVCEPGTTVCLGGQIVCQGGVEPTEEVCDGLDNNCNGETDDGAVCPPNYYCVQGDCRQVCDPNDEFSCPSGLTCVEWDLGTETVDICLPETGDCGGETCPDGWICQDDQCVDPCDPNPCEDWQECQMGTCVDVSCTAVGHECPGGQMCVDHECQPDPCGAADCDPDKEFCEAQCDETSCQAVCRPLCLCSPDEKCDLEGNCSPSRCAGVDCGYGERCNEDTGSCEQDPCEGVYCERGQRCFEGDCVDDPCQTTHCPPGFACELADDDGSPVSVCMPDDSYWVGGRTGEDILATGTGGCACTASGPMDSGGLIFWLLGLFFVLRRRQGGAR